MGLVFLLLCSNWQSIIALLRGLGCKGATLAPSGDRGDRSFLAKMGGIVAQGS